MENQRNKLDGRLNQLIKRHARYSQYTLEAHSNKEIVKELAMQEGLFLIEDELCFLLSFMTQSELHNFHKHVKVEWTDEVEIINNRPRLKIPLA